MGKLLEFYAAYISKEKELKIFSFAAERVRLLGLMIPLIPFYGRIVFLLDGTIVRIIALIGLLLLCPIWPYSIISAKAEQMVTNKHSRKKLLKISTLCYYLIHLFALCLSIGLAFLVNHILKMISL